MELEGHKVLVVGLARTGVSVARFLLERKARVVCTDLQPAETLGRDVHSLAGQGCLLRLGEHRQEDFLDSELIVVSPGVPLSLPEFEEARAAGIEVIGDVELFFRFASSPMVAVTGTNGKTTTVSLIHHILRVSGIHHWAGGNIGQPLTGFLLNGSENRESEHPKLILAELSSFQLEAIAQFRPWIAAWTNLSEDHLDRYPDMEAYARAKARIFKNQTAEDFAVVPYHDPWLERFRNGLNARCLRFGVSGDSQPEICLLEGRIRLRMGEGEPEEFYETERMRLPGRHNLENTLVAVAVSRLCGARPASVQEAMESFEGLEHRLEFVGEKGGVGFYNDSKATTVTSVIRALESFDRSVLLLAGGKDKGGAFSPLCEPVSRHVRKLFLFGEAAARMEEELANVCEVERVADLVEAVRKAWQSARPGEVVLLSPACSSFDMFRDYEERGETFKRAAREVMEQGGADGGQGREKVNSEGRA